MMLFARNGLFGSEAQLDQQIGECPSDKPPPLGYFFATMASKLRFRVTRRAGETVITRCRTAPAGGPARLDELCHLRHKRDARTCSNMLRRAFPESRRSSSKRRAMNVEPSANKGPPFFGGECLQEHRIRVFGSSVLTGNPACGCGEIGVFSRGGLDLIRARIPVYSGLLTTTCEIVCLTSAPSLAGSCAACEAILVIAVSALISSRRFSGSAGEASRKWRSPILIEQMVASSVVARLLLGGVAAACAMARLKSAGLRWRALRHRTSAHCGASHFGLA